MIVWKAVHASGNNRFWSWSSMLEKNPIIYKIGTASKRRAGWGPLTAFKSLRHAKRFIQRNNSKVSRRAIIKCSATRSHAKRIWIVDKYLHDKLFNVAKIGFFGEPIRDSQNLKLPTGTVLCDSITPIEVVWQDEPIFKTFPSGDFVYWGKQ